MAMVKHLPFINLYTHAKLDYEIFKWERKAANKRRGFVLENGEVYINDGHIKFCERKAKIIKGDLQMFKMNEAFFESLPQVSQMTI